MVNRIRALMDYCPVAIVLWDTQMTIIDASNRWLERYGFKKEDVIGKNNYDVFPETPARWREIHNRCLAGAIEMNDNDLLHMPGGAVENVKWEINPFRNEEGEIAGLILVSEIITNQVKGNEKLLRLHRELYLLNKVTDIATKVIDEFEMLEQVCETIIKYGGFELVWFSYVPDPLNDLQLISPIHKHGPAIHYLDNFRIDLNDEKHCLGPTASSILTNQTVIIDDLSENQRFQPWREKAAVFGLFSSISIPVNFKYGKSAVFAIYSKEKNAFSPADVEILERMRNELVFSIDNIKLIYESKTANIKKEKLINELNIRNRSLEEFTYMVSHNLRAKVADLLGISMIVADPRLMEKERQELMASVRQTSLKLDEIIRDLNSSLLVKGHLVLNNEQVNINDILERVALKIKSTTPDWKINIKTEFSPVLSIFSDQYYLYEALYQLIVSLANYKAGDNDQEIIVSGMLKNNSVVFTIIDNYNRILLKGKERPVFEVYRKLYHHLTEGGIKLFYVEAIIENLGGKLNVNTDINSHVAFSIELPIGK